MVYLQCVFAGVDHCVIYKTLIKLFNVTLVQLFLITHSKVFFNKLKDSGCYESITFALMALSVKQTHTSLTSFSF